MLCSPGRGRGAPYAGAGRPEGHPRASSAPTSPRVPSTPKSSSPACRPFFPARFLRGCPSFSTVRSPGFAVLVREQDTSFISLVRTGPPPLPRNQILSNRVLRHAERASTGQPCDWLPAPLACGQYTSQRTASCCPQRNPIATRTDGKGRLGEKAQRDSES